MKIHAFRLSLAAIAVGLAVPASALKIYLLNANTASDAQVAAALTTAGHTVTDSGTAYWQQTSIPDLDTYDVVYFSPNQNWTSLNTNVEQALVSYVEGGGGLVLSEWAVWGAWGSNLYPILRQTYPLNYIGYDGRLSVTYTQSIADPILNAGLPTTFNTTSDSFSGTFTLATPKGFGRALYKVDATYGAVVGGYYGAGKVVNFLSCVGPNHFNDANFKKLFQNTFTWATSEDATGPGITGKMKLESFVGTSWKPDRVSAVYRDPVTDQIFAVGSGPVAADGSFSVGGPPTPGNYRVGLKLRTGLRKLVPCNTTILNQNVGTITLLNGDCDGSNSIGTDDYLILNDAFDASEGDASYEQYADLNGDGYVGTDDYILLNKNFDLSGD